MLNRSLVRITVAAVAIGGVAAFAATRSPSSTSPVQHSTDAVYGSIPGFANLSPDQRLDRVLGLPGMQGVVEGEVGIPTQHQIYVRDASVEQFIQHNPRLAPQLRGQEYPTVIDIPLRVVATYGSGVTYAAGSTIMLRLPVAGDANVDAGNLPVIARGVQRVFVFVRDQGVVLGGSSSSVLVASSVADIVTVRGGDAVGPDFSEPVSTFVQHFRHPPLPIQQ